MAESSNNTDAPLHCPNCGYCIEMLTQHRCPECGVEFDPAQARKAETYARDVPGHHAATLIGACAVSTLILVLFMSFDRSSRISQALAASFAFVPLAWMHLAVAISLSDGVVQTLRIRGHAHMFTDSWLRTLTTLALWVGQAVAVVGSATAIAWLML